MADAPMVLILVGLAAYMVLAGADFGAGLWTLLARPARVGMQATRDHARRGMGPVWEANHVWLIFILVVCWTAYPVAFGSIMSTLTIPLFAAALGIILRGTAYAMRGQMDGLPERRAVEDLFALSSVLTPFALGAAIGAIAAGRVPVGNARGGLVSSWTGPTPLVIGALAVAACGYLAAVYLSADAHRLGERTLELDYRDRALVAGVVGGALALAGLVVVRHDDPLLWHGLSRGWGAAMVGVSALAGVTSLALVRGGRFEAARLAAALAVAAIVAGWGAAQAPRLLPGLTIGEAAAGHSTLVAVLVATGLGAVVLVPSLVLLFRLYLKGCLDAGPPAAAGELASWRGPTAPRDRLGVRALSLLVVGAGATAFVEPGWGRVLGVGCLVACALSTFALATSES